MKYKSDFDITYSQGESPLKITRKEAAEDLDLAFYLLQTSSASFLNQTNKFIAYRRYNHLKKMLKKSESTDTLDFLKQLLFLTSGIKDLHMELSANINNVDYYFSPTSRKIVYFSNDIFEKIGRKFFLNKNDFIKGKILNEKSHRNNKDNFFVPVINNDKKFYRMVKFFSKNYEDDESQIKNICDFSKYTYGNNTYSLLQNECKKLNASYWILPDYMASESISNAFFDKYQKEIQEGVKDVLIIDNRWNHGGTPYKAVELLFDLFKLDKNDFYNFCNREKKENEYLEIKHRISTPIAKNNLSRLSNISDEKLINFWNHQLDKTKNGKSFWKSAAKSCLPPWVYDRKTTKKIKYSGLIVLLVSQETTSFGELLFDYIHKNFGYKKIIMIGTNTCGAVTYSNPESYFLKNSKIRLVLSSGIDDYDKKEFHYYKKYIETRGFLPKYWISNENELISTINYVINRWRENEDL